MSREPITSVDLFDFLFRLDDVLDQFRDKGHPPNFYRPLGSQAIALTKLHDELKERLMTAPAFPSERAGAVECQGEGEAPSRSEEREP